MADKLLKGRNRRANYSNSSSRFQSVARFRTSFERFRFIRMSGICYRWNPRFSSMSIDRTRIWTCLWT
ncbi:hypothetical protein B9Z55_028163 [Caenorhabditis nigoni]|uniref:Uncharacterized protein n=1 Tax=Caenorhabditis nigoni TaxID=1611254 RepID=A0A2G5SCH8_9PELO|nr:hypothetical protein B9Z55_028163 [Caenorhabditis nigoni]